MKDRKGADFCLGPTHEEVVVDIVRRDTRSWRDLPLNLYQIQAKFRDEIRPRAGLMRGREFIMKDAYSFDVDEAGALKSYEEMFEAYKRIFTRCGLDFRPVEADTGSIGGSRSHEFQVLADSGEDAIVSCDSCEYAANVEQADVRPLALDVAEPTEAELTLVETPGVKTIEDVAGFLNVLPKDCVKTLILDADGELVMALVRGDHELNEVKLKKLLGAVHLELADEERVGKAMKAPVGSLGPCHIPEGVIYKVVADEALRGRAQLCAGANKKGHHFTGVSLARDCSIETYATLRLAQDGDPCPRCEGTLRSFRGIEVGHVFYLGTKYSEAMRCTVLDEQGAERPVEMGCYGIGVSRVMAAAIEQNHDQKGICWPVSLAPFQIHILTLQPNIEEVVACAEELYTACLEAGVEVLYDDRDTRAGGKFKDADLIGVPVRIAIGGRGLKEGTVEVKGRREEQASKVPVAEALTYALSLLKSGDEA